MVRPRPRRFCSEDVLFDSVGSVPELQQQLWVSKKRGSINLQRIVDSHVWIGSNLYYY